MHNPEKRFEIIVSYFEAVNADRFGESASYFAEDGRFVLPGRPAATGRIAIAAELQWALRHYETHLDTVVDLRSRNTYLVDVDIRFEGTLRAGRSLIAFSVTDTFQFEPNTPAISELRTVYDRKTVDGLLRRALRGD